MSYIFLYDVIWVCLKIGYPNLQWFIMNCFLFKYIFGGISPFSDTPISIESIYHHISRSLHLQRRHHLVAHCHAWDEWWDECRCACPPNFLLGRNTHGERIRLCEFTSSTSCNLDFVGETKLKKRLMLATVSSPWFFASDPSGVVFQVSVDQMVISPKTALASGAWGLVAVPREPVDT